MNKIEYDYSKLQGEIKRKYGTQLFFAKQLGISCALLSKKLNNKTGWSQTEMLKACNMLEISDEVIRLYFFTRKVQLTKQNDKYTQLERI